MPTISSIYHINMSPLQALLFILGPIFITIARAASPEEVAVGKIPGYLHGQLPRQSDFLRSTFCYCAWSGRLPDHIEEAHYFQFEYYNVHKNNTYLLEHLCLASSDDKFTCLLPRSVGDQNSTHEDWSEHHNKVCRIWPGPPDDNWINGDRFCYLPHENQYSAVDDYILFDEQKRNLGLEGGQGPTFQPQELVDDVCTEFCDMHAGLPYLKDSKLAPNRIVIYEDMDDMCDHCKRME